MSKETITDQCSDLTKSITVEIPCALALRIEKYMEEEETGLAAVVIEALDTFLRK